MKKNIFMSIILALCVLSLILGAFTPVREHKMQEAAEKKAKTGNIQKIIGGNNDKVAIITLSGVISENETAASPFSSGNSASEVLKSLYEAKDDNSVKGIIVKINSPGGTVGMSQNLYDAILSARKKKPVIASAQDMAASGGYYAASAADRIFALPGSITGSIGVIMTTMDLHKFLSDKLSISENVVKSGKYKDTGSSTRAMTPDERALIQGIVDDSFEQFKDAITKGRIERNDSYSAPKTTLTKANLDKYADGRVFTGRTAKKYGFVDATGSEEELRETMKSMVKEKFPSVNVKNVEFVKYNASGGFWESLFGAETTSSAIENALPTSMKYARKPLYLWE